MGQSADLTNGVQNAGAGFVVGGMYQGNVRVIAQRFFHKGQIGLLIHREFQVNVGHTVVLADLYGTGAVGTVVHHKDLFAGGQKRIQAHIDIQRARAAKQNTGVFLRITVYNANKIFAQALH